MNLDDEILYNFKDYDSQLMRDNGVTPWKGAQQRSFKFLFKFLLMFYQNLKALLQNSLCPPL